MNKIAIIEKNCSLTAGLKYTNENKTNTVVLKKRKKTQTQKTQELLNQYRLTYELYNFDCLFLYLLIIYTMPFDGT